MKLDLSSIRTLLLAAMLLLSLAAFGCGTEIGAMCDVPGSDECVDGAICTNEGDGATCRQVCVSQEDCPEGYSCNGVSNTNLNSCQPDT